MEYTRGIYMGNIKGVYIYTEYIQRVYASSIYKVNIQGVYRHSEIYSGYNICTSGKYKRCLQGVYVQGVYVQGGIIIQG